MFSPSVPGCTSDTAAVRVEDVQRAGLSRDVGFDPVWRDVRALLGQIRKKPLIAVARAAPDFVEIRPGEFLRARSATSRGAEIPRRPNASQAWNGVPPGPGAELPLQRTA